MERAAGDVAAGARRGVAHGRVAADPRSPARSAATSPPARRPATGCRCCRRSTRVVELAGRGGDRTLSVHEFMVGVKRTALDPGELITAVTVPVLDGWQGYSQGRRAQRDGDRHRQRLPRRRTSDALGARSRSARSARRSSAPRRRRRSLPRRSTGTARASPTDDARRFGELAAAASRPIDDHRSTAAYRRHAIGVLATRLLRRAFPGDRA